MDQIIQFQEQKPTIENYWRSIILFGRNVASYKFALAKSLLELMPEEKTVITLDDLAEPFSRNLCEHIKNEPKQVTSSSSKFLDACRDYNEGMVTKEQLLETTVRLGFNNVIDAFHIVNNEALPELFFEKNYTGPNKKIILTDNMFKIKEILFNEDLYLEAEARWKLVETAWKLGLSRNLIHVNYDVSTNGLFTIDNTNRRTAVTSAKDALNGYQKGKCFYCFDDITVESGQEQTCDVDHFFPHILGSTLENANLDGVWNLVLACPRCNRGSEGKFAKVPELKYLVRLHRRNEYLISSHHPLRDTLMRQTGDREDLRRCFLQMFYNESISFLIHKWDTKAIGEEVF